MSIGLRVSTFSICRTCVELALCIWRDGRSRSADTIGLVIFQADSAEAAKRLMENDPAVRNDVMKAEVYPFSIALANGVATGID